MRQLALLGAGGHGKVVADAANAVGWESIVFFDDAWPTRNHNGHWPIIGNEVALLNQVSSFDGVIVSLGDCKLRWDKQEILQRAGAIIPTIVHPKAAVSPYVSLGIGTVVVAGAVINVDVEVGPACIINTGATIDHDCRLAEAVHVSPGAHLSGNVFVGRQSWIGVGATIKQGMMIGQQVQVGAGAVVIDTIDDYQTVVGNPARPLSII